VQADDLLVARRVSRARELVAPTLALRTTRGTPRKRSVGARQTATTDKLVFFATLHWLYRYPSGAHMEVLFGVDDALLMRHIWRCVGALDDALRDLLPDLTTWTQADWDKLVDEQSQHIRDRAGFLKAMRVAMAVDGTEVMIFRPAPAFQKSRFSAKKRQHALNILVVVRLDGRVLWVRAWQPVREESRDWQPPRRVRDSAASHISVAPTAPRQISDEAFDGVPNDQAQWKASGFREYLEKYKAGILADGGFYLNTAEHKKAGPGKEINGTTPIRRPARAPGEKKNKSKKLNPAQRLYNLLVSQHRVVVENAIGSMKRGHRRLLFRKWQSIPHPSVNDFFRKITKIDRSPVSVGRLLEFSHRWKALVKTYPTMYSKGA
jgi:hypothetical protein